MNPGNIKQAVALMENEWVKELFKKKSLTGYATKAVSNKGWNGDCIPLSHGQIRNRQNGAAHITVELNHDYKWNKWRKVGHHYLLVIAIMAAPRYLIYKANNTDKIRYYFVSQLQMYAIKNIATEITVFDIFVDCKRYEKKKK